MATKSFLKDIVIKDKKAAKNFKSGVKTIDDKETIKRMFGV